LARNTRREAGGEQRIEFAPPTAYVKRLARKAFYARLALRWERLWPRLWGLFSIILVFLSVALFDLLPQLPYWFHWLALVGFAIVFGYRLKGVFTVDFGISADDVRNRLERDSGFDHRPLTALQDRPVSGLDDEAGIHLWEAHLDRARRAAERLKVRAPSPGLAKLDPMALRIAVLLIALVGGVVGGSEAAARLSRALLPQTDAGSSVASQLNVWITPPDYTSLAPVFLELPTGAGTQSASADSDAPAPEAMRLPVGSGVLVQYSGGSVPPVLAIGPRETPLAAVGEIADGEFRVDTPIGAEDVGAATLAVRAGERVLAQWPIRVLADLVPEVEFVQKPKSAGRASLQIEYEARDDFAVRDIWTTVRRLKDGDDENAAVIRLDLPVSERGEAIVKDRAVKDLSDHPWAGTQVVMQLFAEDALGQEGRSEPIEVLLPERTFNHPVARALAEARKKLNDPEPPIVAEVVSTLEGISEQPAHFFHDTVVFLAIRVARSRLVYDDQRHAVPSVQDLLWETALRIEDGEFAVAERDLRKIQEELMRALREQADQKEVERLMNQLQAALDKYMAALAEHLERQGLSEIPFEPNARTMNSTDLQKMLQQARELARTGSMEAAKRMLSELNRMLESLRNGAFMTQQNQRMNKARQMMDGMRDLIDRQQRLMDRTFREMQRGQGQEGQRSQGQQGQQGMPQQPGQGQMPFQGLGDLQGQLRRDLGRQMLQMDELLGNIPGTLGQAERSMKGAERALGQGKGREGLAGQSDALQQMRQAVDQMAEQMARQMQGGMGMAPNQQGRNRGQNRDPFGRPRNGNFGNASDDGVKVPTESEIQRAREIFDELRRRSGERARPQPELDYIERLLRRF